jgi:glutamyl-tRNA reductase
MRQAELRRMHARLQSLTPEQQSAVETLTRGLMNKFLHLPMQAIKTAALEADTVMLDAMRAVFNLPAAREQAGPEPETKPAPAETREPVAVGEQKGRS